MPEASAQVRNDLRNLLGYAEEILKAGEKVIADLDKDVVARFHENDVAGLEGVSAPGRDVTEWWLRVARLREILPPKPAAGHLPWLAAVGLGAPTFEKPRLVSSLLATVSVEEASDLAEAGLARDDDVMCPRGGRDAAGTLADVLLRLENMPEFAAAFDEWLAGPWAEWERTERPRRASIAFYNRLFEFQQRAVSMGEDTPVETVMGVGMARWDHPSGRINVPLIEASVELDLDSNTGTIEVRTRGQAPILMLRVFNERRLAAVGKLQKDAGELLQRTWDDVDVGFSPHDRTGFEQTLRMCQARLTGDAVYEPDERGEADRSLGLIDGKLRVTDTWVLYVRPRSVNFRCEDIRRLKDAVEGAKIDDLPKPSLQLTQPPGNEPVAEAQIDLTNVRLGATGNTTWVGSAVGENDVAEETFFFPLPYNDEQIAIARRLARVDTGGAVVQGPPGTGKTHTIANIIAHHMATGRRVLVAAHSAEALSAVQSKLPESIRDLAISVIHSDREGAKRLEQAIDILSSQVKEIDLQAYDKQRIDLEQDLKRTRDNLVETDARIKEYAVMNLRQVSFRGRTLMPMVLAENVQAERPAHAWFTDQLDLSDRCNPLFANSEVAEAGRLRRELGEDIVYNGSELPDPENLPDVARLLAAHIALSEEGRAESMTESGELPPVAVGSDAAGRARMLRSWLDEAVSWRDGLGQDSQWLTDAYALLVGAKPAHDTLRAKLCSLVGEWIELAGQGQGHALRGIQVPDAGRAEVLLDKAIGALATGKKPFGMFSFGSMAATVKACLAEVRIDGATPEGVGSWNCVRDYREWRQSARSFLNRWSTIAATAGLPHTFGEWDVASGYLIRYGEPIGRMERLCRTVSICVTAAEALFPYGVDTKRVVLHLETSPAREALAAALDKEGHSEAHALRRRLTDFAHSAISSFHLALVDLAGVLGSPDVNPGELAEGWRTLMHEASRLHALRPRRERLEAIADQIRASGAPGWAAALLREPVTGDDRWTPETWGASWEWARADGYIRKLSDRCALEALSARRTELEDRQRRLMGEVVRVRTFIGLKLRITGSVAAALQRFALHVRQLGAGTGKSAERRRRAIRQATLDAAGAVPCWIMPEWRVAEQLPSELGIFDLVIIDEASQSDITALPAIMRGKKLLVVGDDKQVSPSAVGMEDRTVIQLRETYLRGTAAATFLEPTTSLYDIASIAFPGSVIMLREHFRCVEPIIAFSKRFYPKVLVPLRVPTATERLDPPLVDVYVHNGRKIRDVNLAEADFIVAEIKKLLDQPEYAGRTFGVISLIGDKQAKLIQARLVEAIGTGAIARHRIMCGNASTFQGQERDVMFLSMVACPQSARAQTARLMQQRFNVAMSRARDRLYLVRSVSESRLQPEDLKLAVIEHFKNPMAHAQAAIDREVLEETESDFEREVGGMLLDLGYKVRPQVRVGAFRIDFVVEGEGDRRLAIELDGDRYHGPDRWHEDIMRQRALERIGWTFWRCWGSHWLADKQGCFDDLRAALRRMSIEPTGGGEASPHAYTEHRRIGDDQGPVEVTQPATAEPGHAVFVAVNNVPEAGPAPRDERSGDDVVEVGDTVIIRFADNDRVRRFRITRGPNNLESGEVSIGQPIAVALLGNAIEEEVNLVVDGQPHRVIIEKITKAA